MAHDFTMEDAYTALTTDLLLLALDDQLTKLARTPYARHTLKQRIGHLRAELAREMPGIEELFAINGSDMTELYQRSSELVPRILSLKPEDWQIVEAATDLCSYPQTLKYRQMLAVLAQPNK